MAQPEGLPVHGYVSQSADAVETVQVNKVFEEQALRRIDALMGRAAGAGYDPRMLAIARTQIETGFMWLNRAIFRPARVSLPGDGLPRPDD